MASYLDLLQLFREESDHNVWAAILGSCHYLYQIARPTATTRIASVSASGYLLRSPKNWAGTLPGENDLTSQLRGELLSALGTLGNDATIQAEARTHYVRYKTNPRAVDPNIVPALVAILAHTGGRAEYEEFHANVSTAKTPQEEQRYLFALAAFRSVDLLDRTLTMTINGEVRTQNAPYLMRSLLLNIDGRERVWAFMKQHWEEMTQPVSRQLDCPHV